MLTALEKLHTHTTTSILRPFSRIDSGDGRDRGNNMASNQSSFRPRQLEANAHVVHIKLMRNNSFVTVTDAKGNTKAGISAGQVAGRGTLLTRYSGGAAAESMGRRVRQMKINSVVVKVNGHCAFKKKKDSILSFRDGFSDSRNNVNPVVYVEDTTRKPHNGCRRPKQRRTKKKNKKGN